MMNTAALIYYKLKCGRKLSCVAVRAAVDHVRCNCFVLILANVTEF